MSNKALLAMIGTLAIVGSAHGSDGEDQVRASFDRDLNHQAVPERQVQRETLAADPLYKMINSTLWTAAPLEYKVLASFHRDLHRETMAGCEVSQVDDQDVLTEAFNGTLWTAN